MDANRDREWTRMKYPTADERRYTQMTAVDASFPPAWANSLAAKVGIRLLVSIPERSQTRVPCLWSLMPCYAGLFSVRRP
jgi:hypothetical protein